MRCVLKKTFKVFSNTNNYSDYEEMNVHMKALEVALESIYNILYLNKRESFSHYPV